VRPFDASGFGLWRRASGEPRHDLFECGDKVRPPALGALVGNLPESGEHAPPRRGAESAATALFDRTANARSRGRYQLNP
jgi:hypothetical protein